MSVVHGGDPRAIARRLGRDPAALLDLSANINPAGPPPAVRAALRAAARAPGALAPYPDPRHGELRAVLARRDGSDEAEIAIGNGSAALLDAVVRAVEPQRCALVVPSFSEYRKLLDQHRVTIVPHALAAPGFVLDPEAFAALIERSGAEFAIVANPNNPTGVALPAAAVRALAARIPQTVLLIDEAFVDYVPEHSIVRERPANVVVLRSLTKFYGLAGVRAGYALATPALAVRTEAMLPSWPVGTLDARLAAAAPGDAAYEQRTRRTNARERAFLTAELRACGFAVVPSSANFLLCDASAHWTGTASALADRLVLDAGILVRACDDFTGLEGGAWIRIAVRTRAESRRIAAALRALG